MCWLNAPSNLVFALPAFLKLTPIRFPKLNVELARGCTNSLPGFISLIVCHALNLIEPRYGIAYMACIFQRLLPLFRKGELLRRHVVTFTLI